MPQQDKVPKLPERKKWVRPDPYPGVKEMEFTSTGFWVEWDNLIRIGLAAFGLWVMLGGFAGPGHKGTGVDKPALSGLATPVCAPTMVDGGSPWKEHVWR